MADKKTKPTGAAKRRTATEIDERNKASVQSLINVYGPKGDGKKASTKKK